MLLTNYFLIRKLSFSREDSDQPPATGSATEEGEMIFALENIVEEPAPAGVPNTKIVAPPQTSANDSLTESSTSGVSSASNSSQVIRQAVIVPVPKLSPIPSVPSPNATQLPGCPTAVVTVVPTAATAAVTSDQSDTAPTAISTTASAAPASSQVQENSSLTSHHNLSLIHI